MNADYAPLLYVPADRPDLPALVSGEKFPHVQSIALCLEDAVRPSERRRLAADLRGTILALEDSSVRVYVRPADEEILQILLDLPGIERIDGFIVPKSTSHRIGQWAELSQRRFALLPIMETREALDPWGRRELVEACAAHHEIIPRVRIGVNDLFSLLGGLRRPRGRTIYETPLGRVIDELITVFTPRGFPLSGAVFDRLDDLDTLARECVCDVERGLFAKASLTPQQVHVIAEGYRPSAQEAEEAMRILQPDAPAVFRLGGSMQEPACHRGWAEGIMRRAQVFNPLGRLPGLRESVAALSSVLALTGTLAA